MSRDERGAVAAGWAKSTALILGIQFSHRILMTSRLGIVCHEAQRSAAGFRPRLPGIPGNGVRAAVGDGDRGFRSTPPLRIARLASQMENPLSARTASPVVALHTPEHADRAIAAAYNQAGDKYLAYADGDPRQLYAFDGQYSYGDRMIWETLFAKLCAIRATGARSIRILDLGCGPGTWLRRVVTRARAVGFDTVTARGFDIAGDQVKRAQQLSAGLTALPGVGLSFEVGDIFEPLAEGDASVDLTLCLCGVLNHLPSVELPPVFAEIARVTKGYFVTTARTVGSTPSVYVEALPQARRFRQDNRLNRLDVEFQNGRQISLPSHLFSASELRTLVTPHLAVEDICGLDLFHGRFAGDPRWNPDCQGNEQFVKQLEQLEKTYCRDQQFLDHATHLLLVGKHQKAATVRKQPALRTIGHVAAP